MSSKLHDMERSFPIPKIVVSKCLEFEHCRWNGDMIHSDLVKRMMPRVDFVPVCMEKEIGLGVPRDPVRVVLHDDSRTLFQPATGRDVTGLANSFMETFFTTLGEVDGFLLKSQSPSCGIKDVKVYPPGKKVAPLTRASCGIFGETVMDRYPDLAIEDESRLSNFKIAEHYLTRIFTRASFREVREGGIGGLVDFHTDNKYLFMAYSQTGMRKLGRIVANGGKREFDDVLDEYGVEMDRLLSNGPRCSSNINVLMHALGHVSEKLTKEEKAFFMDSMVDYREGRIPLTASMNVIRSWMVRFNDDFLDRQTYFEPFPSELLDIEITDSCLIRDYWKNER